VRVTVNNSLFDMPFTDHAIPIMIRPQHSLLPALFLIPLLTGCGGSGIYPVEGQVVWKDGTPAKDLAGSLIMFEQAEKKTSSQGMIDAAGGFTLTTDQPNDGAPEGDHTVVIIEVGRKSIGGGPDGTNIAPAKIDTRYMSPQTSDLKTKVTSGENKITLTIEPNPQLRK
jgi:hypothetical protein